MTRNTQPERHPHGEQLSAYGDGMLDVATIRTVAAHLSGCAACRTLVGQSAQTKSRLRDLPAPVQPGPEFWSAAYRRLRLEDRGKTQAQRMPWDVLRQSGQRTQRRWAAGLAAAALLAGAAVIGPNLALFHPATGPSAASQIALQPQDDTPDVSALVESHTDSVSRQPLSDPDRQKMIAADVRLVQDTPQGAANADGTF